MKKVSIVGRRTLIFVEIYCCCLTHHCGMYVPLSDDKHRKLRDSSKKRTGNPRQNARLSTETY